MLKIMISSWVFLTYLLFIYCPPTHRIIHPAVHGVPIHVSISPSLLLQPSTQFLHILMSTHL